jgi:hypothetical protein
MRSQTVGRLALAWLAAAPAAHAIPTTVTHDETAPCDILSVPEAVHELGEAPAFSGFPTELIAAAATITNLSACPSTDGTPPNAIVLITNLTGLAWSDLWYVGDPAGSTGGGGTTLSNVDGVVNGGLAFKIDAVGINTPLVSESIAADGIFTPGEVWTFIIDDYANGVPLPPDALDSIGVGVFSGGGPPSSGSIIAVRRVAEPSGAGLLVAYAAARAWRRRNQK